MALRTPTLARARLINCSLPAWVEWQVAKEECPAWDVEALGWPPQESGVLAAVVVVKWVEKVTTSAEQRERRPLMPTSRAGFRSQEQEPSGAMVKVTEAKVALVA